MKQLFTWLSNACASMKWNTLKLYEYIANRNNSVTNKRNSYVNIYLVIKTSPIGFIDKIVLINIWWVTCFEILHSTWCFKMVSCCYVLNTGTCAMWHLANSWSRYKGRHVDKKLLLLYQSTILYPCPSYQSSPKSS